MGDPRAAGFLRCQRPHSPRGGNLAGSRTQKARVQGRRSLGGHQRRSAQLKRTRVRPCEDSSQSPAGKVVGDRGQRTSCVPTLAAACPGVRRRRHQRDRHESQRMELRQLPSTRRPLSALRPPTCRATHGWSQHSGPARPLASMPLEGKGSGLLRRHLPQRGSGARVDSSRQRSVCRPPRLVSQRVHCAASSFHAEHPCDRPHQAPDAGRPDLAPGPGRGRRLVPPTQQRRWRFRWRQEEAR